MGKILKLLKLVMAAVISVGLLLATAAPAGAYWKNVQGVGFLGGKYIPADGQGGGRKYIGYFNSPYVYPEDHCVVLLRKTAAGDWTSDGIYVDPGPFPWGTIDCDYSQGNKTRWEIRNFDYVQNTHGIRVYNQSTYPNNTVTICNDKTACLALRDPILPQ